MDSNFARELRRPALGHPSSASPGCRYLPGLEGPVGLQQERWLKKMQDRLSAVGDTLPDGVTGVSNYRPGEVS